MTKQATSIAFIGGGNMARSLINGLISDGYAADSIWVADPDEKQHEILGQLTGIHITASNQEAAQHANVVIFAVKPQVIKKAAEELGPHIRETDSLVISIAAGIRTDDLGRWLGNHATIIRAMPNTPAMVQSSATALYADNKIPQQQRNIAESILRAVGLTLWLEDEAQMDAVTALSGSGPAYFFLIMEMLENAGHRLGLPTDTARLLILQTAFGAAKLALETPENSATLRQQVTSPGGTTERAITVLQTGKLQELMDDALKAAHTRAIELADQLGGHND